MPPTLAVSLVVSYLSSICTRYRHKAAHDLFQIYSRLSLNSKAEENEIPLSCCVTTLGKMSLFVTSGFHSNEITGIPFEITSSNFYCLILDTLSPQIDTDPLLFPFKKLMNNNTSYFGYVELVEVEKINQFV